MTGQVNRNATLNDYMKLRNQMLAQKTEQEKARKAEAKEAKEAERKKIREVKRKEREIREIKKLEKEFHRREQIRQLEQKKAESRRIREQKRLEKEQKKDEIKQLREQKRKEKERPIKERPVKERPVKERPVKEKQQKAPVKREVPMTTAHKQYLMRQEQKATEKAEREAKEAKIKESFATEKKIRDNESGIRRYFLYDLSNPVDVEIVQRIQELARNGIASQELTCTRIIQKRLRYHMKGHKITDQLIEQKLLQRCLETGKTRNELVRELFCIQFNLKEGLERVNQTHNPALLSAQGIAGL